MVCDDCYTITVKIDVVIRAIKVMLFSIEAIWVNCFSAVADVQNVGDSDDASSTL